MSAQVAPVYFQTFGDVQEFIALHCGGKPFDYSRDDPETLERADWLGIRSQVEACIAMSRELDPVIDRTVARVEREQLRQQHADDERAASERIAPLPGYSIASLWEGFTPPAYLVKRILAPGELTILFGQSGHFKSVAAIDLTLCVGSGTDFHGVRTRRAGVLYVAGEGHAGIKKRMRAWLLDRDYDATSEQPSVYVTSEGANLIGNPAQLRATVEEAARVIGVAIELVVIDTLAANFGPGDENHATDMQLAVHGARHAAPGAAVLLLHHVGHGQSERERGSYALVAAADCRLQATYDEISKSIEIKWHKLKDDERPEPMIFNWRAIALEWKDEDGEELTSVVLDRLDGPQPPPRSAATGPAGRNQETALKVLRVLLARARKNLQERGDNPATACILTAGWKDALAKQDIDRRRFHEVLKGLTERGLITVDGPHVYPVEPT